MPRSKPCANANSDWEALFILKRLAPGKTSARIRSAAQPHSEEFKECVALQAQYVFDTFGKFPGTVPSMIATIYLQAHHLDLEFYDEFYKPGAYLHTHRDHMNRWHPDGVA